MKPHYAIDVTGYSKTKSRSPYQPTDFMSSSVNTVVDSIVRMRLGQSSVPPITTPSVPPLSPEPQAIAIAAIRIVRIRRTCKIEIVRICLINIDLKLSRDFRFTALFKN